MPARMVINTESTIGYNNQLKQATSAMKLGINNDVNTGTNKAALKLMAGGSSKVNPPNTHPSNPIHKAAGGPSKVNPSNPIRKAASNSKGQKKEATVEPLHETNKTVAFVVGVGAAGLLIALAIR